ncbi:copper resistance protein CopC [Xylophilus rhododendri]|uniref:Copper resistance protein CopC n=1 Tax=Xylophilus rhododendri TaxID=2697032 RepID=A0A857J8D1_9BURK|nr:copper resistance protein CopC [Xylophilus rhododendri]QHI99331.1 copper resistance protein CopC [Xylophilus rhododendri]
MSLSRVLARAACAAAVLLASTAALANPQLLASNPAENAEVPALSRVELNFSEKLAARSSAAKLTMTSMPGMTGHPPMPMAVTVSAGEDGKTMLVTADQPLPKGSYRVDWRAASGSAKPVTGTVNFTVK